MSEKEQPAAELEINNVQELDAKLAEAIDKNDNKPTDEEVEEAQKKFQEASEEFGTKSWDIGEPESATEFTQYLSHFLRERVFWTQNGWMGVIKMQEELDDAEKFIATNPESPLKLGYQALEFIFYSLQNPGGVGLESAKNFEGENELYAKVFDAVGSQIAEARKELKEIQFLQDQYAAMAQGFYLEVEPPPTDEEAPQGDEPVEEKEEN